MHHLGMAFLPGSKGQNITVKQSSLPYYLLIAEGRKGKVKRTALFRIWTLLGESISYVNNRFAQSAGAVEYTNCTSAEE